MPRAFLIKKHSPGKDNSGKGKIFLIENEETRVDAVTPPPETENEDLSNPDTKGPYDLSVRPKKTEADKEEERISPLLTVHPTVIEFSPKIVTHNSNTTSRSPGIEEIAPASPLQISVSSLETASFHPTSNSRFPPWTGPLFNPYFRYNYSYLSIPRPSEFCNPPGPYLGGTPLVSPPLMPIHRPQIQLSPRVPDPFPGTSPPHLNNMDLPLKDHPTYLPAWSIPKEGCISPPRSDSGESSPESGTSKYSSIVSSSTGNATQAPRYQCVDCSKSYATYSGLSRHRQFHCITQTKKAFNCKYCDKVYISLGALKMHIRTHTLPCKCDLCGKAFSRPWLLQGHIRTHTGEKPFSCQYCNRAFADRSNLRAHLQTHSDIKKYSCSACSKTFSRMSLLSKHNEGICSSAQVRPTPRYPPVALSSC